MGEILNIRPESVSGRLPRRIIIVGNNESAWMAAALLSAHSTPLEFRVTILANGPVQSEFPGEASLPSLRGLLANLRIDEHEMMRQCQGTYCLATQFSDWVQSERDFWKPFASEPSRPTALSLFEGWHVERSRGRLLRPFHSYSLHWAAALAGKSPYGFSGPSPISQSGAYAFHVDGELFAGWLRSVALRSGTEEIAGEIQQVAKNGRGGIAQIKLTDGTTLTGDFFVDCTGSDSRLMRLSLNDQFIHWNDRLLPDRMLLARLPGRRQIPPYTRITGLPAGWSWQIPLAYSVESGYLFQSALVSDDEAREQFQSLLKLDGITPDEQLETSIGTCVSGRQTSFWRDNVLALGTSACRLDPLTSAGRHLSQLGLELFLELFPDRSCNRTLPEYYNQRMRLATDEIRDVTQLHYLLSKRKDSDFWNTAAATPVSPELTQRLALYEAVGHVGHLTPEALPESGYQYLLTGCGRLPATPTLQAKAADPNQIQQGLRDLLKFNETTLKNLPLHEELLDWIHAAPNPVQKSA
ncbi:MAG: tryptophan 7-halogenase [Planctomycetaceae bacterium]